MFMYSRSALNANETHLHSETGLHARIVPTFAEISGDEITIVLKKGSSVAIGNNADSTAGGIALGHDAKTTDDEQIVITSFA